MQGIQQALWVKYQLQTYDIADHNPDERYEQEAKYKKYNPELISQDPFNSVVFQLQVPSNLNIP
jgi:hypothetical protein